MRTVEFPTDKALGKALYFLVYGIGGTFRTKPERQLVIDSVQYRALEAAGLLPKSKGAKKRGKKKT